MKELWMEGTAREDDLSGLYVAISGNTSAGKSTLIRALQELDPDIMAIQERSLHHPLLRKMFSDPDRYAFPIQLSFVLQRHLALYSHLSYGHRVIIERSHLDDELFIREHADQGRVAVTEMDAWFAFSNALNARLRNPDVLVLMNPPAEVSLRRLTRAEETGQRPREFPDEDSKRAWVYRWYDAYEAFHADLRVREWTATTLVELDPAEPTEVLRDKVWAAIREHPRSWT